MRVEVEGIYPGLGSSSLIRTLAWILVDMGKDVFVLSEDVKLDRKFCDKPSGSSDGYLLDLATGEEKTSAQDYANRLHPRLRILESSSVLNRREREELQEELMEDSDAVILSGCYSGKPARRFMVIPSDPSWLVRDKERLYELSIDHLFVSHLSRENQCQDIYEAYVSLLRKPFSILPTCPALQREWLERPEPANLTGTSYGKAVKDAVERILYPDQVQEERAVYRFFRRFGRKGNGE